MAIRLLCALFVVLALTTPASTASASPGAAKVLVFIEENHSLAQMRTGMPYLYSQAVKYGYATHYTAVTHPSLPNYLAISSGSTFGIADDKAPSAHPLPGPTVFGVASSAKSYQESMPSNCSTTTTSLYAARHNPWVYVPSERAKCLSRDVPAGTTTSGALRTDLANGTLPAVGEVTPNIVHDAHDGTLAAADTWLKGWLARVYASPDWKAGRLVVIVTADEDDYNQGNTVLTTVIHPSQHAHVVSTPLTHYSLSKLMSSVGHAACIRNACPAPMFAKAFALPLQ